MVALLVFLLTLFALPLKSKSRLEAENAVLRHQLTVLRRKARGRVLLSNGDHEPASDDPMGAAQRRRPVALS